MYCLNVFTFVVLKDISVQKYEMFQNLNFVEITIQGIICATVKLSVESVVESVVSRYERHFNKGRQLSEENALDEMEIAENGPTLFKADRLLQSAMNKYWRTTTKNGKWHFLRSSTLTFTNSGQTVSKLMKKPSKFPIMDEQMMK